VQTTLEIKHANEAAGGPPDSFRRLAPAAPSDRICSAGRYLQRGGLHIEGLNNSTKRGTLQQPTPFSDTYI
jgi:hypothetical protein